MWPFLALAAAEPLAEAPFMACQGTEVIKRITWEPYRIGVSGRLASFGLVEWPFTISNGYIEAL